MQLPFLHEGAVSAAVCDRQLLMVAGNQSVEPGDFFAIEHNSRRG